MADLSTLDPTQPPDTQAVSLGAQRIRETRDSVITSFELEHALAGMHKFLMGNASGRPAAGNAGRIYLNTTDGRIEEDNGSAWTQLHAVQAYVSIPASAPVNAPGFGVLAGLNVDVLTPGVLVAIGICQLNTVSAPPSSTVSFKILADAFSLLFPNILQQSVTTGTTEIITFIALHNSLASGTRTITFEAGAVSGVAATVTNATLMCLLV